MSAREYTEKLSKGDYDAFVDIIAFEKPEASAKPEVKKIHASALKTIHKPSVDEKGGIKEVAVTSEKVAPDGKSAEVVLTNTYNNGAVETVSYAMIYVEPIWKVKVNDNKEVWTATSEGDKEVVKIRDGAERDFVKTNDDGEKQFIKEITKRDGQVEIIKTLENGERHKEVFKELEDGNREVEKLKDGDGKTVLKDIDDKEKETLKAKDHEKGEKTERQTVVIEK